MNNTKTSEGKLGDKSEIQQNALELLRDKLAGHVESMAKVCEDTLRASGKPKHHAPEIYSESLAYLCKETKTKPISWKHICTNVTDADTQYWFEGNNGVSRVTKQDGVFKLAPTAPVAEQLVKILTTAKRKKLSVKETAKQLLIYLLS